MISALHVLIMSIAYRLFRCKGQGVFFFKKKGLSTCLGRTNNNTKREGSCTPRRNATAGQARNNTANSSRGVVHGQGAAEFFITCVWIPDG